MNENDAAAWPNALPDKLFIEFFYKHLAARRVAGQDQPDIETHLALAEVRVVPGHFGGMRPPVFELLCTSPKPSPDDTPVMVRGQCCGFYTGSWLRNAICPVCSGEVKDG